MHDWFELLDTHIYLRFFECSRCGQGTMRRRFLNKKEYAWALRLEEDGDTHIFDDVAKPPKPEFLVHGRSCEENLLYTVMES